MKIIYISQLYNNTYRMNKHYHDFWEIVYYTKGNGILNVGDELVSFRAGDIFALPPLIPHYEYSDEGYTNFHFNFNDEEFGHKTYIKMHDTEDCVFLNILRLLHKEFYLKRDGYQRITDALYEVLRCYMNSFMTEEAENPYIAQIIDDIIGNMSDSDYDVNNVLDSIPLNNDYLRKLFQKETGKTPLQYLIWKRMLCAKRLLQSRDKSRLTLKEISNMCGFNDYYYFSRVFKQEYGISPRNWLNNLASNDSVATAATVKHDEL